MNEPMDESLQFNLDRIANIGFVNRLIYVESTSSTNDLAREVGQQDDVSFPAMILTSRQTAGRGRGDHKWESANGALTFSLVIDLPDSLEHAKRAGLSIATGLSIVEAITSSTDITDASIKWPNDVLVMGKKVGGILIEQVPGKPSRYVFGIGVNVNNAIDSAKLPSAISIIDVTGTRMDITQMLLAIIDRLESNVLQWFQNNNAVIDRCQQHLAHRNLPVTLQTSDNEICGKCEGLDQLGRVVIRDDHGRLNAYSSGTLRF